MAGEEKKPGKQSTMQLAEILSDLTSLRVCEPKAALALVSARRARVSSSTAGESDQEVEDADLQRAKDLVELHYSVKEGHRRGELGRGLEDARRGVEKAVGG